VKRQDLINYPEKTLMAYLEDPTLVVSRKGMVVYVNPAYRRHFNVNKEDVVGRMGSEVLPGWLWQTLSDQLPDLSPEDLKRSMWTGREEKRYRISIAGMAVKGRVGGAVVMLWDASGEALNRKQTLELYRSMTADLGYPLEEIKSLSARLSKLDDPAVKALGSQLEHVNESVLRLREFGEIFLGDVRSERVPFHPGRLVNMVLKSLRPMAEQKGVYLEDGSVRELPRVVGDPALLNRVLGLLVDYMVNTTPRKELVIISPGMVMMEDGSPRLSYSITGTGVVNNDTGSAEDGHAMESYSGLPDDKKRTLLRLLLAKKLVTSMGGKFAGAAQELAGTTIHTQVPVEIHYSSGE